MSALTNELLARVEAELFARTEKALAEDFDVSPLLRLASRLEPRMRRQFLNAVHMLQDQVDMEQLALLIQGGKAAQAEALLKLNELVRDLGPFAETVRSGYLTGAKYAVDHLASVGLEMSFNLVEPHAVQWARSHSSELIREVVDSTKDAVRTIIGNAIETGIAPRSAAREVRSVVGLTERQAAAVDKYWDKLLKDGEPIERIEKLTAKYAEAQLRRRGEVIARTETLRSANEGTLGAWREAKTHGLLPVETTYRIWIATMDDRTDTEICLPMDGAEVPLDDPFVLPDGTEVMTPTESHPQCRCTAGLTFKRGGE